MRLLWKFAEMFPEGCELREVSSFLNFVEREMKEMKAAPKL
jgi:hypothetical protein